jgi:RNA polymerase sigma factor (sigma-70 family)
MNPFTENTAAEIDDRALAAKAVAGSRKSLEELLHRHQPWIYNIAYRMVFDADDAEDIMQEVLIKIITRLSTYNPDKGTFRTWLYRITANHVISLNRSKRENLVASITNADLSYRLESIPDNRKDSSPNYAFAVEEAKSCCLSSLILSLDRRERLAFILGSIFGVNDSVGSRILEISKTNFRTILSRARKNLYSFLDE